MADELVTFLRDRLDEDDETARKATVRRRGGEAWSYDPPAVRAQSGMVIAERIVPVLGEHIAGHDPARTLAEVEAKRRIIRAHDKWCQGECEAKYPDGGFDAAYYWSIKSLAAAYGDHPAYREEWRP
jgi:hypothetical protein